MTWKLFSGGSSFFDYRKSKLEKEKAYFSYIDKKDELTVKAHGFVHELVTLKKDYEAEKFILDDIKSILEASKSRYKAGTLSSQDLNSDVSSYIRQQNEVLDLEQKILDLLLEFSSLISEPNYFSSFVTWKV